MLCLLIALCITGRALGGITGSNMATANMTPEERTQVQPGPKNPRRLSAIAILIDVEF